MRVVLAGAGSAEDTLTSAEPLFAGGQHPNPRSAPANILSQEEDGYQRAFLRREGHSPEEGTSSYESWLRRSRVERKFRSSEETLLDGRQPPSAQPTPANIRSQEEDEYRRAQLRREGRSPEEGASSC